MSSTKQIMKSHHRLLLIVALILGLVSSVRPAKAATVIAYKGQDGIVHQYSSDTVTFSGGPMDNGIPGAVAVNLYGNFGNTDIYVAIFNGSFTDALAIGTYALNGVYPNGVGDSFSGEFTFRGAGHSSITGIATIYDIAYTGTVATTFAADVTMIPNGDVTKKTAFSIRVESNRPVSFIDVPEPSSFLLTFLGGLVAFRRKRK